MNLQGNRRLTGLDQIAVAGVQKFSVDFQSARGARSLQGIS
jgi:hypothetical protein